MNTLLKNPLAREGLLVLLAATLMLAWSSLPDWSGYASQDSEHVYAGTFFDVGDHAVHIAMLRAGWQGHWDYQMRFTSEPHQGRYIRMFYLLLGQADRLLGMDPEVLFQVARWLGGYSAFFALFGLLKRLFPNPATRWIAFFLAALGSGLGYLQLIAGWVPGPITPVDLWLIDAYMLFSLALFPHFAFTLALMCLALAQFLDYLQAAHWKHIAIVVITSIAVQLINPIAFVVVDVAMGAAVLASWWKHRWISWDQAGALCILAIAQLPLLLYNFTLLQSDPIWSQFTRQNETLSPAPIYYLWGFGLLWPPALIGAVRAFKQKKPALLGACAWVAAAFLLAYAPFAIQRRFLLGITIPLGLLAAFGLELLAARLSARGGWLSARIKPLLVGYVLAASITSLLLSPAYALLMRNQPKDNFYPADLQAALGWIRQHTGSEDLLLGAEDTGRLVAQETGRRVFLGHEMETLDYPYKQAAVAAFYAGRQDADWLELNGIHWIIYGPYESKLAPDFQAPAELELVYREQGVSIYRVPCSCASP